MRYREVEIQYRKTLADSGTETIDLNLTDPVTEMLLWFFVKNGAAKAPNVPAATALSKVEVVDGSDTLVSLSAQELIALYAFEAGKLPYRHLVEAAGVSQYDCIPIRFGRFPGDKIWAFDPTRFTNPQVKLTWAKNTLHATGEVKYSLYAKVMEEVEKPTGLFMSKSIESFTSAASGDKKVELPTDYPYRKLLVRAYEQGVGMNDTITNLKLSLDIDKIIPFDLNSHDFIWLMHQMFPPFRLSKDDQADNADSRDSWMGVYTWGQVSSNEDDILVTAKDLHGGYYTLYIFKHDGTDQTDKRAHVTIWGVTPENVYCYPFGDQQLEAEWLKATDYKSVRLILTQGNDGGACDVFLQQARKY